MANHLLDWLDLWGVLPDAEEDDSGASTAGAFTDPNLVGGLFVELEPRPPDGSGSNSTNPLFGSAGQ